MKLEELARQSSEAARLSVVHLDPPPIGERRQAASWHRPVLAALAVAVLAAGVASVFLLAGDDGDSGESIVAGAPDVPRLGLPELDAYSVAAAFELTELGDQVGAPLPQSTYYGTAGVDDPYADGDLLVVTIEGASEDDFASDPGTTVQLRGTTARLLRSGDVAFPVGLTLLQWIEPSASADAAALGIAVASRSLAEAELIDVASRLAVDLTGPEPVVSIPDDLALERVGDGVGSPFTGTFTPVGGEGFLVVYEQQVSDRAATIVLSTRVGRLSDEAAALRFWSTDAAPVSVGGRPGIVASVSFGSEGVDFRSRGVVWEPTDGVVATLTYSGTEVEVDVVALAESASELDDETWAFHRQLAATVNLGAYDEVYGQGNGTVNDIPYSWAFGIQDGDLCVEISSGTSGSSACGLSTPIDLPPGSARTIDVGSIDDIGSVLVAAAPDVDAVYDGSSFGIVEQVEAAGLKWFMWVGAADSLPRLDVIIDGTVVDTLEAVITESAEPAPVADVAANPSAQELGIVDDFALLGNGGSATLDWALGTSAGDLCLVTDGEVVSAGCFPADDLTVFGPLALGDGSQLAHLVIRDLPDCVEPIGTSSGATVAEANLSTDDGHTYSVWAVEDTGESWELRLIDPVGDEIGVDLPAVDGTTSWPADLC